MVRDHPRVCGEHLRARSGMTQEEGSSPRMRGTLFHALNAVTNAGIIPAYAGNTSESGASFTRLRDHPRVCGEHSLPFSVCVVYRGSSPRMRGTPGQTAAEAADGGIIPAYAGNTQSRGDQFQRGRDHPRVCGEHPPMKSAWQAKTGSSPRMRGTRNDPGCFLRADGIIPAYAGNTIVGLFRIYAERDHPRVCGEHLRVSLQILTFPGSSPRMRGTQRNYCAWLNNLGIIPAYAGNTSYEDGTVELEWDHPRVCGEHLPRLRLSSMIPGSSPRMRGTLLRVYALTLVGGIIPAYAGNTSRCSVGSKGNRDHPRVCGEHLSGPMQRLKLTGSSPRMRGTPEPELTPPNSAGIIPAYAGNTRLNILDCCCWRDHPRVCGEHQLSAFINSLLAGSSPRMRGTLKTGAMAYGGIGIIPAYAGNTQRWGIVCY